MADTTTDRKIRVGIIGCGGISESHLPNLAKFEDVELVAFCDIVVERAQKKSAKYGGAPSTTMPPRCWPVPSAMPPTS